MEKVDLFDLYDLISTFWFAFTIQIYFGKLESLDPYLAYFMADL